MDLKNRWGLGLIITLSLGVAVVALLDVNSQFNIILTTRLFIIFVLLIAMCAVVGKWISGRIDGIFIDDRNKISLSRFQLVLWTLVLLTSLFGLAGYRIYTTANAQNALNIGIPDTLLLLAGISLGSAVASPLIRNVTQESRNNIQKNNQPIDAKWSNMFEGETNHNYQYVDISKLQNFLFTIILFVVYAILVLRVAGDPTSIQAESFIMPPFSESMITLLGISHAGYLIAKGTQT